MATATPTRFHSLDSLRGWMMLLGVVLHAACAYTTIPMGRAWPYKDAAQSGLLDILVLTIHAFRMPAFFLVAGLFACLLVEKRGLGGMLANRFQRIGLPLIVGWFALLPLTFKGFMIAEPHSVASLPDGPITWSHLVSPVVLGHLWFLYYLLMFYAAVKLLSVVVWRVPVRLLCGIDRGLRRLIASPYRALPLGALTFSALYFMRSGGLDTSTSIVPSAPVFWAYAGFFGFGWAVYRHRDLLGRLEQHSLKQLALGALLLPATFLLIGKNLRTLAVTGASDETARIAAAAISSLCTWLLALGALGLFLRYARRWTAGGRYLSDASYWVYLTHLPIVVWVQAALAGVALPAMAKFSITLLVAAAVTLVTYHLSVRATFIGQFLNGRRYPRSLPDAPNAKIPVLVGASERLYG